MASSKASLKSLGRLELLAWLNELLETDYTKIEHCADGIAYCQIFDAIFHGTKPFPMHKLNFNARFEEDNVKNLKVLDEFFKKNNVPKSVPEKLAKGKFQDNNEFLNWAFLYLQKHCPTAGQNYKAFERRLEAQKMQMKIKQEKAASGKASSSSAPQSARGSNSGPSMATPGNGMFMAGSLSHADSARPSSSAPSSSSASLHHPGSAFSNSSSGYFEASDARMSHIESAILSSNNTSSYHPSSAAPPSLLLNNNMIPSDPFRYNLALGAGSSLAGSGPGSRFGAQLSKQHQHGGGPLHAHKQAFQLVDPSAITSPVGPPLNQRQISSSASNQQNSGSLPNYPLEQRYDLDSHNPVSEPSSTSPYRPRNQQHSSGSPASSHPSLSSSPISAAHHHQQQHHGHSHSHHHHPAPVQPGGRNPELEILIENLEQDLKDRMLLLDDETARIRGLHKERDTLFDKLRSIEMLCELHESANSSMQVKMLLHESNEAVGSVKRK